MWIIKVCLKKKKISFTVSVCMMCECRHSHRSQKTTSWIYSLLPLWVLGSNSHYQAFAVKCFTTKPDCQHTNSIVTWNLCHKFPSKRQLYMHAALVLIYIHISPFKSGCKTEWMHGYWMPESRCGQRLDAQKCTIIHCGSTPSLPSILNSAKPQTLKEPVIYVRTEL